MTSGVFTNQEKVPRWTIWYYIGSQEGIWLKLYCIDQEEIPT